MVFGLGQNRRIESEFQNCRRSGSMRYEICWCFQEAVLQQRSRGRGMKSQGLCEAMADHSCPVTLVYRWIRSLYRFLQKKIICVLTEVDYRRQSLMDELVFLLSATLVAPRRATTIRRPENTGRA